jgi:hypothetical protein
MQGGEGRVLKFWESNYCELVDLIQKQKIDNDFCD